MINEHIRNNRKMLSLSNALVDDLLEISDKEILDEVREDGDDPHETAQRMRKKFNEQVMTLRKKNLVDAKLKLQESHTVKIQTEPFSRSADISVMRKKLRFAFQQEDISMAARNETESELSDDEVRRKYLDLVDLGVITPEE